MSEVSGLDDFSVPTATAPDLLTPTLTGHAKILNAAIQAYGPKRQERPAVLDLGCGEGEIVRQLEGVGYTAFGCDVYDEYSLMRHQEPTAQLRAIKLEPYRLPFDDNSFDAVVSTQVLEHVQNKAETFAEIRRVLKPGGVTVHVFPSKWHLPFEPHLYVPLASWMWPRVPKWWLALWAILGVRNGWQKGKPWRETVEENVTFMQKAVDYRTLPELRALMTDAFGHFESPMSFYLKNSAGKYASSIGKLPGVDLLASLSGIFRQRLVVSRYTA